jgi:deoxyribose-phosphate aldolase
MDDMAKYIDHTFLNKQATKEDIERVCQEAIDNNFKAVCVFPEFLSIATKKLYKQKPLPITVIDFPLGEKSPREKAHEAQHALDLGAKELDMVMDFMALKNRDYQKVYDGIKAVVNVAKDVPVKVILEVCYLNPLEIASACTIAKLSGAKFVKTSTGFAKAGATVDEVLLMKNAVGKDMQVKASGGIKDYNQAKLFIEAGATRIGTSKPLEILKTR